MNEQTEIKSRSALAGWPMILGWLAMMIFALHASTHMVGAGDTWVAMACGRHFVNHGVDTVEPFSANSHRAGPTEKDIEKWPGWARWIANKAGLETVKYWHPTGWINQNWLTHVIFYLITPNSTYADGLSFTSNALVYWKFALYILTVICVYYTGRILGANPALCAVFACFAMFVGRSFFDIRPAGFSNLLVAVFLLILALTTYRNILYIWLIVPIAVFWCNVHGGYIYLFIMLVPFTGLNLVTSISKKRFTSIGLRGVYHTIAAGFVTLLATIIFNPFHLTNFTHTIEISISKHAERWRNVNEWHPAFEWKNPVGDEIPFLWMYIIVWAVLVVWAVVLIATYRSVHRNSKRKKEPGEHQWPKIDIPLMAIAGLTIYMAIRSRRFIPVAAIVACPILAALIDQAVRSISATINFQKRGRLTVLSMSQKMQSIFIGAGVVAVLFFGTWWSLKFKRVYLDPWPTDAKYTSMFIRMTASDAKPFYALKFIKDNKLEGKMFNYWTEGGFIGWGQEPDPNTGKTPLRLFMDGRAQAAYQIRTFDLWSEIMGGGEPVRKAMIRGRKLNSTIYNDIGKWLEEQFKKHEVWIVLMPSMQFDTPFVRGLERNGNWRLVFFDNRQKMYANIKTPQGEKLFQGILTGETIYPTEFTRNLAIAHMLFFLVKDKAAKDRALEFAFKAFKLDPSQAPVLDLVLASRSFQWMRPKINELFKNYIDEFTENQDRWKIQDGYFHKIAAALITSDYLTQIAKNEKNTELVEFYTAKKVQLLKERTRILKNKRW